MKYFDHEGTERNEAWLHARFGAVSIRNSTATGAFRIQELRESIGPAVYVVKLLDEHGQPMNGEQVARTWPDPQLPELPENEWYLLGVHGPTKENEGVGFASGGGDYYDPKGEMRDRQGNLLGTVGASSFWVLEWPSDCIEGIGTLGGTEHAHLDMVLQWIEGEEPPEPPPPPPPPPDPDIEKAKTKIMEAQLLLDEALELLGG